MISPILPIRVAQFVLSIIILGMVGYVAHEYNKYTHVDSPSEANYLIFVVSTSLVQNAKEEEEKERKEFCLRNIINMARQRVSTVEVKMLINLLFSPSRPIYSVYGHG